MVSIYKRIPTGDVKEYTAYDLLQMLYLQYVCTTAKLTQ